MIALLVAGLALASPVLTQLENGLTVYVEPRPGSPSVTVAIAINVGSAWETEADNGAVHFLEHYLFTGTERWTEFEVQDEVERRGGTWNGHTTLHKTLYHVQLRAQEFESGLDWIDQVVFHPRFDPALLERERGVVFQERGGRKGWAANTFERLGFGLDVVGARRELLFGGSGYALDTGGEDASLDGLTLASLRAFYDAHYMASNAALLVVGGVEPGPVLEAAGRRFGPLPARPRPAALPAPPPPGEARAATLRGPWDNDEETLSIGARAVGITHPDYWALRVLTQVLDKRLTRELRQGRGLVYGVSASLSPFGATGELSVTTRANAAHTDQIRAAVLGQLDALATTPVPATELRDAIAYLVGSYALSQEDNFSRAWWAADAVLSAQPPPDIEAGLGGVTAEDVTDVTRRYMGVTARVEVIHDPILTASGGAALGAGLAAVLLGAWRWRRRPNATGR